ncbi:MAG TPA: STAS domain-containing protein [Candidatus Sulfotelmatobacter sp.]|nr:STAS domain-containing protein [Candidatus Sulfotelmatobacter sp.]
MENSDVVVMDEQKLIPGLEEAGKTLNRDQELALDFSAVGRVGSPELRAMQNLAHRAEEKSVRVVLRGVNVNVYKTLKLAQLTRRFSFLN